jgi:Zn finger protein HypA/HybF involved in hydrogenase expression
MYSIEFLCDTCGAAMEYEPAEFESLPGRPTVEQHPPAFVCPNCGNEQPVDFHYAYR